MAYPDGGYNSSMRRVNVEVAYAGALSTPPPSSSSENGAYSIIGDSEMYSEDFRSGGPRLVRLQGWITDSEGQRITFGDPRDPGNFVMDHKGRFIGLYVGGNRGRNIRLVSDAQELFEDIKRVMLGYSTLATTRTHYPRIP
ncbi:hypothetical protein MGYG_01760 [Nannizzia gypsea CBS 118893]|uniref:Uncharacterized protein n=1 Tax=Arthroderma gypseum (strain ATCC MYA-4604 / CBS 118893) TaxID=535722 RepID=E5R338_ARTGP|nr:hypothetical protein MGYG_01760 [Nannizzia gypsea CBS 118893]EFQ98742.1 hypothetical protein MGYG_01760 [Nannizzia gypsea CBS 118893]